MARGVHPFGDGLVDVALAGGEVLADFDERVAEVGGAAVDRRAVERVGVIEKVALDQTAGIKLGELVEGVVGAKRLQLGFSAFVVHGAKKIARDGRFVGDIAAGIGEEESRGEGLRILRGIGAEGEILMILTARSADREQQRRETSMSGSVSHDQETPIPPGWAGLPRYPFYRPQWMQSHVGTATIHKVRSNKELRW